MRLFAWRDAPAFARCANGRKIYVDRTDERGKRLIEAGGNFNRPSLAMWQLLLTERNWTHVVDVGANYGEMLVGVDIPKSATVIAFEPNPHLLPYLKRTIRQAGCDVEVIAAVVSAQPGTASLTVDRTWSGLSTVAGPLALSEGHVLEVIDVPATTLARIIDTDAGKPVRALVKIDVEGHEIAVLQGACELIDRAEDFAAMVEILHASEHDLGWLLARFAVELYDVQHHALVPANVTNARDLFARIDAHKLYLQDAVLRRRRC